MYASKSLDNRWLILILKVLYVLMEVDVVVRIVIRVWLLLVLNDVRGVVLQEFLLDAFLLLSKQVAAQILLSLLYALLAYAFDDVCLNHSPLFRVFGVLFILVLLALLFAVLA
jgi:hypothetical protein